MKTVLRMVNFRKAQLDYKEKHDSFKFFGIFPITYNLLSGLAISISVPILTGIMKVL